MNKYFIVILFLLSALLLPVFTVQAATDQVVISEIQLGGTTPKDEWVELYNPTDNAINITGWRLARKTASGVESNLLTTFPSASIPAHGYFLITHPTDYTGQVTPDLRYSTSESLAKDNTVILYSDAGTTVVDKIGFGAASDSEGATVANPENNTSVERKPGGEQGNSQDTDDNNADFFPQPIPTPNNSVKQPVEVSATVKLNEILPDPADDTPESIELFSTGEQDITGWTIEDATGKILTLDGVINQFHVFTLAGSKLNNAGDIIILKDASGAEQDRMSYGDQGGATKPNKGETLIRLPDGADTNNDTTDWQTTNQPTLGSANQARPTTPPPPVQSPESPTTTPPPAPLITGIILISEFVSDPTDDEEEWIELFSQSTETISLDGWLIEEGSEAQTKLTGTLAPETYIIVSKPKGSLNNTGDRIALIDSTGTLIDSVSYGAWLDGNVDDNAPKTTDPNSVARSYPYADTDTDSTDFKITTTPTKAAQNIITDPPPPVASGSMLTNRLPLETNPTAAPTISFTHQLAINEVLPNPAGEDSKLEFIEIKNISPYEVELTGLKIQDANDEFTVTNQPFTLRLPPDGYIAFRREQTKLALNNTGGEIVRLRNPDNSIIDEISYSGSAEEGTSYARGQTGEFFWTTIPTPDAINSAVRKNLPPIAVIHPPTTLELGQPLIFDGSDSRDPDGTISSYDWRVDRKSINATASTTIIFTNPGDHIVTLTITDNQGADHKTTWRGTIAPTASATATENVQAEPVTNLRVIPALFNPTAVHLSELLPNPDGADTNEWIELVNNGIQPAALAGWSLTTAHNQRPFFFTTESVPANGFLVLGRERTRLTLNNTSDRLRLLDAQQNIIDEATYDKAPSGAGLVRDEQGHWVWTQTPTPNLLNTITTEPVTPEKNLPALMINLDELSNLELDTLITAEGTVTAPPDILGKHTIYISDDTAGSQVYLSNETFPVLELGTRVRVSGVVRQSQGERRILVRAPAQIEILGKSAAPEPAIVTAAALPETPPGQLIQISGQVTQKRGNTFFVDDGSDEMPVYVKAATGIKQPLSAGDSVVVAGIVSHASTGPRLLPRFAADIKVGDVAGARVITLPDRVVSGSGGEIFTLPSAVPQDPLQKYLLVFLALSTVLFAGLWVRDRMERKSEL